MTANDMKRNELKKRKWYHIMILSMLMLVLGAGLNAQGVEDPEKHSVSVDAVTFPVFAVDAAGNPVFNLKKHDFLFTVNGKPVDFQLLAYQPEPTAPTAEKTTVETTVETTAKPEAPQMARPQNRVIILVLDSMFNTKKGFKRSKAFLKETITTAYPGETFIVLENAPKGGMRSIAGPTNNRDELLTAVDKLKWYPEKYRKFLFIKAKHSLDPLFKRDYFDVSHGPEIGASYKHTGHDGAYFDKVNKQIEHSKKMIYGSMYREKLKAFGKALSQFKYVLQTINYPKIVFLISEGVAEETIWARKKSNLKDMSQEEISKKFYFHYLRQIITSINASGTVLYTISPKAGTGNKNQTPNLDEVSLEYLANKSGGKYFKGADIEKVAEKIKQNTSAYYELVFTRRGKMAKRQAIDIKCKRDGITLYSPRYNERSKRYNEMEPVQKKVFAHNLIIGGNWSRMIGKVRKVTYQKMKTKPGSWSIAIAIPEKMKRRKADMFLIIIDTKTGSVNIALKSKVLAEQETITLTTAKGKAYYFAIIDPVTTYCIYSDKNING